ncbi:MAG: translation initiation factor [Myxococcota bacterium]
MTRKRVDRSSTDPEVRLQNPFANLAALRDALPGGSDAALASAVSTTTTQTMSKARQRLVLRKERAGRGGKTVTVIEGLALDADPLSALVTMLKKSLGCGASLEDGAIVLQGDVVERAAALLRERQLGEVVIGTSRERK